MPVFLLKATIQLAIVDKNDQEGLWFVLSTEVWFSFSFRAQ